MPDSNVSAVDRSPRPSSMRWVLLFVVAAVAAYAASLYRSGPGESWPTDLARARAAAAESGRPVLIEFTSESCPYCVKMEREVLSNAAIAQALAGFELVQVDAWKETELADRYHVNAVPTFVVEAPDGRPVSKLDGYVPVEPFAEFLRRASQAGGERTD